MHLMQYVGNAAAHDQTGILKLKDRPDVHMGGVGEMTDQEIATFSSIGMVLAPYGDGKSLSKLKAADLEKKAADLGVEVVEGENKDELLERLYETLAKTPPMGAEGTPEAATGGTSTGASGGPTGTPTGGGTSTGTAT